MQALYKKYYIQYFNSGYPKPNSRENTNLSSILLSLEYFHYVTPIPEWNGNIILWDICHARIISFHYIDSIIFHSKAQALFPFSIFIGSTWISTDILKKKKVSLYFSCMQMNFPCDFLELQLNSRFSHESLITLCFSLGSESST